MYISHSKQVTRGIHTDCLLNYETVKYFNGEQHESDRYRDAIRQYQTLEYKVIGMRCLIFIHATKLTHRSFFEPVEPRAKFHHCEYYSQKRDTFTNTFVRRPLAFWLGP